MLLATWNFPKGLIMLPGSRNPPASSTEYWEDEDEEDGRALFVYYVGFYDDWCFVYVEASYWAFLIGFLPIGYSRGVMEFGI
jgi:hypothetical protein